MDTQLRKGGWTDRTALQRAVDENRSSIVYYLVKEYNQDISKLDQKYKRKIEKLLNTREFQRKEKIEKLAFALALRDGKAKALGIKLLLFGPENVGKTCVAATLVGDPFEESAPTEGADLEICNTSNWSKISQEEASQRMHDEYLCNLKSCADQNTIAAGLKVEAADVKVEKNTKVSRFFTKAVNWFSSIKGSSAVSTTSSILKKEQTPAVAEEEIQGAKAATGTYIQAQDGIDVTILDFAGQVQYHNTHSAFIRKENIILVVFNASQPLSQNVKVRASTLRSDPMTNSQNIHFWMKTVHSICHEPGDDSNTSSLLPIILLVATHLDLLGHSAAGRKEEIIQTLADELEGKPYAEHLAGYGEGLLNALRKYCIILSNKHRDPQTIQLLRDVIVEISAPILSKEHPLVFLKIEKMLLGYDKGVITKDEFHQVASSCGFLATSDSEEFAVALQYFHDRGSVLHFANIESLKGLVILSPHWLTKLFSYILIAHPYQRIGGRIGGRHDNAFRILTQKGILVGSFLFYMLELFNGSEKYASFEIEQQHAVDIMKKFYFVAQIDHRAKFLKGVKIGNENELYIVPSLLPKDEENSQQQNPETGYDKVRVVHFYLPDRFIPPMLFSQMMAMSINRNEDKREEILWLRKDKAMMVLGRDQYYCLNICEEKYSLQLSFMLLPGGRHSADLRIEFLKYFESKLEMVMEDFMKASSKPVACIPCYYCEDLHVELQLLLEGEQQHCAIVEKPLPDDYYCDLITNKATGSSNPSANSQHASTDLATSSADLSARSQHSVDGDIPGAVNFDCAETIKSIKKNYVEMMNLPIDAILGHLYAKEVITARDKQMIETSRLKEDKMTYFVDNVVTPSLQSGVTVKFKRFLEVMEESGDPIFIKMAIKFGGSKAVPLT